MKHSNTRALYDYWDELRRSRPAPLRSELDPRAVKALLSDMFILQRDSAKSYTYRLAGTVLCHQFRRELRGENFLDNWSDNEAESIGSLLESITQERSGAVLGVTATYDDESQASMEYLFLPVRLDATREIRILGCCSILEPAKARPQAGITGQVVASLRLLWPDNASRFMDSTTPKRAANDVDDTVQPHHRSAQQRGHLWVIEGGGGS